MPGVPVLNGPNLNLPGRREPPTVGGRLTGIHRREPYRHTPFVSEVADAVICSVGTHGYVLTLTHLAHLPKRENRWPRT